ncbi:hypothetical protein SLE2022_359390 [Rubroshorea leprosula]
MCALLLASLFLGFRSSVITGIFLLELESTDFCLISSVSPAVTLKLYILESELLRIHLHVEVRATSAPFLFLFLLLMRLNSKERHYSVTDVVRPYFLLLIKYRISP